MRAVVVAFVSGVALAAVSAHAAPLPPKPSAIELGAAPPVELVAGGCGWGWHRQHWRDRWGYWHRGIAYQTGDLQPPVSDLDDFADGPRRTDFTKMQSARFRRARI